MDKIWTWEVRDPGADILFVTNMYPDSERPAYGIFVKRQIESLRRRGLKCDVLYIRGYQGFHTYMLGALQLAAGSIIWRRRYRLIHAHAGESGMIARFMVGIPVLTSYCGDDLQGHYREDGTISRAQRLRRWVIQQHTRLCSATITKSSEMEGLIPTGNRGRNHVVPNGVDTSQFKPRDRAETRSRLGWKDDGYVVLFAATRPYEVRKRLSLAEQAIEIAAAQVGPIRLHIAENVAPDEVPLLMSASDCLLLTSRMEGSPNVVKEALMSDLPVVSTRVGDVDELLSGVEPSAACSDDPNELGNAVASILSKGGPSNGRTLKAHLSDTAIAERLEAIYFDLASR